MLDQTRTIDNKRIKNDALTALDSAELTEVETMWQIVLGLE
jgi:mRNA-degrading endonuclease toxin of MazEF toxin-antitoxin module